MPSPREKKSLTSPLFVRSGQPQDRQALFEICLRTADSGGDATALYSDPDYPGLIWSVPYLDFEPAHCFVVDDGGTAVGFVVGAADTVAYEKRLAEEWWPDLQAKYGRRKNELPLDGKVLDYIRNPVAAESAFFDRYPAHLHINLLPPAQSGGWGRKLIEAEIESLRSAGVRGVHLGVSSTNYRAIGFYEHVGFTRLAEGDGGIWYGMIL